MKYISTHTTATPAQGVDFKEAVFNSLPSDGGLYMPEHIPRLDPFFFKNLPALSLPQIAETVLSPFVSPDINKEDLSKIVHDAFDFPAPLRLLDAGTAVLELFHGPSLAFKDFGARFMSRVMGHLAGTNEGACLDVLVATSGDTGGAVAMGFHGVKGTRVTILYPKGKVSDIQELQLTTQGENVLAIEVDGDFDDCQRLVKEAFLDADLAKRLRLTSANSINIARWLPQSVYFFYAYAQLLLQGMKDVVFVVPSGNFGNIAAGVLAQQMGLPVRGFVAATNANDTIPQYLDNNTYQPKPTRATISNAMDVSDPSNWVRIMELYRRWGGDWKSNFKAYSFSDAETVKGMDALVENYNYVACPHTAIAWLASNTHKAENPAAEFSTVFLATAHPCKFPEVLPTVARERLSVPASVQHFTPCESRKIPMKPVFAELKQVMLGRETLA